MLRVNYPSRSIGGVAKLMKRREKGFTLLQVVIGVGIMALVALAAGSITNTLLMNHGRAAGQNAALPQVQNASHWISRDVHMARTVTPGGSNGFPLSLSIPVDDDENNDNSIEYVFDGDKLKRKLYDPVPTLISETHVADHVDTDNTLFTTLDAVAGHHKLTVTASRGGTGVTRSYEISQRLGGS